MTPSPLAFRASPTLSLVLALGLSLTLTACGGTEDEAPVCTTGAGQHRTELYFGRDRQDGPPVSDAEWQDFVDTVVTPRFSAGLTSYDADGQYLLETGELIHERSKVLVLLHDGSAARSADINTICEEYKQRFHQESVLRLDSTSCVTFT